MMGGVVEKIDLKINLMGIGGLAVTEYIWRKVEQNWDSIDFGMRESDYFNFFQLFLKMYSRVGGLVTDYTLVEKVPRRANWKPPVFWGFGVKNKFGKTCIIYIFFYLDLIKFGNTYG